jgi:hypothetical protein
MARASLLDWWPDDARGRAAARARIDAASGPALVVEPIPDGDGLARLALSASPRLAALGVDHAAGGAGDAEAESVGALAAAAAWIAQGRSGGPRAPRLHVSLRAATGADPGWRGQLWCLRGLDALDRLGLAAVELRLASGAPTILLGVPRRATLRARLSAAIGLRPPSPASPPAPRRRRRRLPMEQVLARVEAAVAAGDSVLWIVAGAVRARELVSALPSRVRVAPGCLHDGFRASDRGAAGGVMARVGGPSVLVSTALPEVLSAPRRLVVVESSAGAAVPLAARLEAGATVVEVDTGAWAPDTGPRRLALLDVDLADRARRRRAGLSWAELCLPAPLDHPGLGDDPEGGGVAVVPGTAYRLDRGLVP